MKLILVALLVAAAAAMDYEDVLMSPLAVKALYSDYAEKFGYSQSEAPMRLRIFRRSLKRIVKLNKRHEWESGINMFTAMTKEETQQYLGFNASLVPDDDVAPTFSDMPAADAVDWREQGKVTAVVSQGSCGSCWAHSAAAAVETGYALLAGDLQTFSVQEYVECTYPGRGGCNGGWYWDAWKYSASKGHLATKDAYPYTGKNGDCKADAANGLTGAKITGAKRLARGEADVIAKLNDGAVAVAYEVTRDFFAYKSGIIKDNSCRRRSPTHAVTAVGYTADAMILKNSWGAQWGMEGYFLTGRNHHGCGIWNYGAIPTMEKAAQLEE